MSVTLANPVSPTDSVVTVAGDLPARLGFYFRLDDELLYAFDFASSRVPRELRVQRAIRNTVAAAHNAGTPLLAVTDAVLTGADLGRPLPFVGAAEGGYNPPIPISDVDGLSALLPSADQKAALDAAPDLDATHPPVTYQTIDLSDTDATEAQFSDVLDTRGGKSLTLLARIIETSTPGPGNDLLFVAVLTRRTGTPWMVTPIWEYDGTGPFLTGLPITTLVASGGNTLERYQALVALGLLDETIVLAGPRNDDPAWSDGVDATNGIAWVANVDSQFAEQLSIELVDPAANDSPLAISSVDGYVLTISLETDSVGDIVTTLDDIGALFQNTYPYVVFPFSGASGITVVEPATATFTAEAGTATMNYSVQGTV